MEDAEQKVTDAIEATKDPELKAALKIVWAKRVSPSTDRNSADWGIAGTGDPDESTLTIGIVRW